MKKAVLAVLILAGALLPGTGVLFAQESSVLSLSDSEIQLLRQDLQSKKKQLVAANMQLTDAEAQKFWPVYEQYTAETTKLNDYRWGLIKEYAENYNSMTDDQAQSLITRAVGADESVVALRLKYIPLFGKVLPAKKVARFFQLDRRITAMQDLQLASRIPLAKP